MILTRNGIEEFVPDSLARSVTELNRSINLLFETTSFTKNVYVKGNVLNIRNSRLKFFTLQDHNSSINCVFEGEEELEEDKEYIVKGSVYLYEKQGKYQLIVSDVFELGLSKKYKEYLALKRKLKLEGFFSSKKTLKKYPSKIGLITSEEGAAYQDVKKVLSQRQKSLKVYFYSVRVQGSKASSQIIQALKELDNKDLDAILIVRGGGSAEDLECFNDEDLVKQIYKCKTRIVTGIGHESDETLVDYASDVRCGTPSIAAETVSFKEEDTLLELEELRLYLQNLLDNSVRNKSNELKILKQELLDILKDSLYKKKNELADYKLFFNNYDYKNVLEKGYAIVRKNDFVVEKKDLEKKDVIEIQFRDGKIKCEVL